MGNRYFTERRELASGAGCQACSVAIRGDVWSNRKNVETNLDTAGKTARATLAG